MTMIDDGKKLMMMKKKKTNNNNNSNAQNSIDGAAVMVHLLWEFTQFIWFVQTRQHKSVGLATAVPGGC